ncbi:MAG: hypothetical protein JW864_02170 [Spirochaetes bacterium]|nr:hypothetical protein [Spirochaetota bacterium]
MRSFTRKIIFINIPHIFIEAEKLRCKWSDDTQCVIASGESRTSLIIDAPDDLRPAVVRGMFLKDIKKRINVITADFDYMNKINRMIMDHLKNYSITVECDYSGGFYIDLTGTERLFGRVMDTCGKIISELGSFYCFNAQIGAGGNKLVSYMAAKITGSNSVYEIDRNSESMFLAPAKIDYLPDIPSEVKREVLSSYNIQTISDLSAFSKSDLKTLFKKHGDILYSYSRNIAPDCISAAKEERVLNRSLVLSDKANDDAVIRRRFFHLVSELCQEMRRQDIFPLYFELKIIYRDHYKYARSGRINDPTFIERKLYTLLLPYLESALSRRTIVKKIMLCFYNFIPAAVQESLFSEEDKDLKLSRAFDSIRDKFGKRAIFFAE